MKHRNQSHQNQAGRHGYQGGSNDRSYAGRDRPASNRSFDDGEPTGQFGRNGRGQQGYAFEGREQYGQGRGQDRGLGYPSGGYQDDHQENESYRLDQNRSYGSWRAQDADQDQGYDSSHQRDFARDEARGGYANDSYGQGNYQQGGYYRQRGQYGQSQYGHDQGGSYGQGGYGASQGRFGQGFDSWNGQGQGQYGSGRKPKGPKNFTRSDERLREEVCERLMATGRFDVSEVSVEVKDGEVTLEGTVESRQAKYAIESAADSVYGVKDVTNRIKIDAEGAQRPASEKTAGASTSRGSSSERDTTGTQRSKTS